MIESHEQSSSQIRPVAQAAAKTRLRDSCHACASSKVKCHKEKPTCSRCANRGVTCEYYVTKRPGRRRGNNSINHNNNSTINSSLPSPSPSSLTPPLVSNKSYTDFFTTALTSADSASLRLEPLDLLSDLVSPNNSDPTLSSVPSLYTDQDDFFTTPINFPELETSLHSTHDGLDLTAFSPKNATFSVFGDAFPNHCVTKNNSLPLSSSSCITTAQAPPATRENSNSTDNEDPPSPCCCLTRALGLLKHPFPNTSPRPACTMSNGPESCSAIEMTVRKRNPEAQAIVANNQQTVEVVSNILQCQCSQDGYLLTILALVVSKVLDWYEALGRELPNSSSSAVSLAGAESLGRDGNSSLSTPSSGHRSDVVVHQHHRPDYCADGEDLERMAAQRILSQLHRVQRVVNQLSPKLKSQGTTRKDATTVDSQLSLVGQMSGGGTTTSPFSAPTLDHIEADLRKRLRGLSIEIIDMLRHA